MFPGVLFIPRCLLQGYAHILRALAAFKDFVTLSKDAGVGIPVFKQAKAEYPKHQ
jgi:hypothetical protein